MMIARWGVNEQEARVNNKETSWSVGWNRACGETSLSFLSLSLSLSTSI